MDIIQSLLDTDNGAYRDQAGLNDLLGMLGLGGQSLELDLRIARQALRAGDTDLALAKCLHLANAGYKSGWELCAQVVMSDQGNELAPGAAKQLLGFVLAHCHEDQVGLA